MATQRIEYTPALLQVTHKQLAIAAQVTEGYSKGIPYISLHGDSLIVYIYGLEYHIYRSGITEVVSRSNNKVIRTYSARELVMTP